MRSFADTCCSASGSGSRTNLFGEPLARTNDPAAIAPAAAVLMNFRREFFSALLSDLRITGLLHMFWVQPKSSHATLGHRYSTARVSKRGVSSVGRLLTRAVLYRCYLA